MIGDNALLRLLQLTSPALPVGAYAYSRGLEYAVTAGWVDDERSAAQWLSGVAGQSLCRLDVPVLLRLYRAWQGGDEAAVNHWNDVLYASRESAELQLEDRQLGLALARLLGELGVADAMVWRNRSRVCYATLFALAAERWSVTEQMAAYGYLWACWESQMAAAIKLVPLGQTAGQRILSEATELIPRLVEEAFVIDDEEIGVVMPALAIGSAHHETQYSRLFRS